MVKKLKYLLFLIPFFTMLNVNAVTLSTPSVYYYENDTPYSTTITTDNWSNTNVYAGSYIGNFGTNFPIINRVDYNWFNLNICSGKNVSISGSVHAIFGFFLNQSYTLSFYMNNEQLVCSTSVFDNGNALHYDCYGNTGGGTFSIYLTENSFTQNINYHTGVSQDVTYSCDVSNEAIVNQSITNTQNIINNQNSNTNTITQNQDTNTQNIINNQNQNTQQEIQSQKVCKSIEILSSFTKGYLDGTGNVVSDNSMVVSPYYSIDSTSTLTLITNATQYQNRLCFYTSSKSNISCISRNQYSNGSNIPIPSNAKYFRATFLTTTNTPRYTLCTTGNQALSDDLNNLNDTLNDTSQPNTNQDINDMNNMVSSFTPITDLITMPLTLINAYSNGITSSCSPYNLGNLYGTNIILPCLDLQSRFGSDLWGKIDVLFCIFMCYNIGMLFVSAFDGLTSLRDDFEGLYQPRHADTGYQPKHGGGN